MKNKPINTDRLFPAIFGIVVGLHLLLLWQSPILPFIDLPFRLAASTISRFFGESSNSFSHYYSVDTFFKPNSFHLLFCSLKIFSSVEFANKVFYSLYVMLLPFSIFLIVKKIGGNTWFSMLSFLLLYNFSAGWGFSEFTMAIPVILFFFYFVNDYFKQGGFVPMMAVVFLLMLLFFIHVVALLFSLFLFSILSLYYFRKSPAKLIRKGVVVLPVLFFILLWWRIDALQDSQFRLSYLWFYFKNFWFDSIANDRTNLFSWDNFALFSGAAGKLAALGFSFFIFLPLILKGIFRIETASPSKKNSEKKNTGSVLLVVGIFLGCALFFYLFMPHKIADNFHLYQRFAVFVLLAVVILDSLAYRKVKQLNRVIIVGICVVVLLHFFLWAGYFKDFNRETRTFTNDLFPKEVTGKKLAGLIYDYTFRGRPVYIHFPDYYIVRKQGIAGTCLIDYRFGTIRRKAGKTLLPPQRRIEWIGKRKAYDGRFANMDYILVRGEVPQEHEKYMVNFILKRTSGRWSLYEKIRTTPGKPASLLPMVPGSAKLIAEFSVRSDEPYLWSMIEPGSEIYLDRSYVYTIVPRELMGLPVLRPTNNDKYYGYNEADFPFISFRVKKDVTLYIIYTNRHTNLEKTWLNRDKGWVKENFIVETTLAETKSKRLVSSRFFPAGSRVELGGNGCRKRDCDMYTVVIKEKK